MVEEEKDKQKELARKLLLEGKSMEEVVRETGLSKQALGGVLGWLRSPAGKLWIQQMTKEDEGESQSPPGSPGQGSAPSASLDTQPKPAGILGGGEGGIPPEPFTRELWLTATPVIRKVVLNPKVYLYYDWVREKYGYKGDLGDFLFDCVEDFFRSRRIRVVVEEEVP